MKTTIRNPNPQAMQVSAYETVTFIVTMTPPLSSQTPPQPPWTGADTFQVNVRDDAGNVVLQSTAFTVTDFINGIVQFPLTSSQTGEFDVGGGDSVANPTGGDFQIDFWRTTPGSEKRLAWGPLTVLMQQWKP